MSKTSYLVNIVCSNNGVGLSRDSELIYSLIRELNIPVKNSLQYKDLKSYLSKTKHILTLYKRLFDNIFSIISRTTPKTTTINFFIEHIDKYYFHKNSINCFIPNPEYTKKKDIKYIQKMDYILCKTHETEKIFEKFPAKKVFIGFTSKDRMEGNTNKTKSFFHLAGSSRQKGTDVLVDLWLKHPEWPTLTIVQNPKKYTREEPIKAGNINYILDYVDDKELKNLQNNNLFHLCPSESEGFGHYIVEALSCGAITLTTDAPPMNELVRKDRGILVSYKAINKKNLGTNYYVDEYELEKHIKQIQNMTDKQIRNLSIKSRQWFLRNDSEFKIRLKGFIEHLTSK